MNATARNALRTVLLCCALLTGAPGTASTGLDLHHFAGRVVYLDFWASWCAPCRQSFPWMQALESTYQKQGLAVVAVNVDHNRADAERFLDMFASESQRVNFPIVFDPQGNLAEQYKVVGMPTSVLIDRHGVVRFVHVGFQAVARSAYEQQVRQLLAEK